MPTPSARFLACLTFVLFQGMICASSVTADDVSAADTAAVDFDWEAFGRQLRNGLPDRLKNAPELEQVEFLSTRFADELARLEIAPNHDEQGRTEARRKYGPENSHIGICGDTSRKLRQCLLAAGIEESKMRMLAAQKVRFQNLNLVPDLSDILNGGHVALLYVDADETYVFDLWAHGRENATFSEFNESKWSAMTRLAWEEEMWQLEYDIVMFEDVMNEMFEFPPTAD